MTENTTTPFARHYPARPNSELAGLLRDLTDHPDHYGPGDRAVLLRVIADRLDSDLVRGWSPADLRTLVMTAGEIASTYGTGTSGLDGDDVLSTRQRAILHKAARDYHAELGDDETTAQEQGIQHILGAVNGTVFRSDDGETVIFLNEDPYVIRVDEDGDTTSAYLVTVPPAEIAGAMDADEDEIGGWSTGYDI